MVLEGLGRVGDDVAERAAGRDFGGAAWDLVIGATLDLATLSEEGGGGRDDAKQPRCTTHHRCRCSSHMYFLWHPWHRANRRLDEPPRRKHAQLMAMLRKTILVARIHAVISWRHRTIHAGGRWSMGPCGGHILLGLRR